MTNDERREYLKCKDDIVYFVNAYCYKEGVKITLLEWQKDYIKNNIDEMAYLTSRQIGFSVATAVKILHRMLFDVNVQIGYYDLNLTLSRKMVKMVKDMYFHIPEFMKKGNKAVSFSDNKAFELIDGTLLFCDSISTRSYMSRYFHYMIFDNVDFWKVDWYFELCNCLANLLEFCDSSFVKKEYLRSVCWASSLSFKHETPFKMLLDDFKYADKFVKVLRWDVVPNRNDEWKAEIIKMIGNDYFKSEYECKINILNDEIYNNN